MVIIKSFSVGNGDMFYIQHNSDNFSIIDCSLCDDNKDDIIKEIKEMSKSKNISRFISTHPDEDHIQGIHYLDNEINIQNFYCVKNNAIKTEETESFKHYCKLRDNAKKVFHIEKNCNRKWMNQDCDERGSSGLNILWPHTENNHFKEELKKVANGESPNNISPIIKYSLENGVICMWMGDLETEFMNNIKDNVRWEEIDILFAPHHGRKSGKVPEEILSKLNPKIIIIGEANSDNLDYYQNYNTITQNSAKDILFDCETGLVHIFTSNDYSVTFLKNKNQSKDNYYYVGTLEVGKNE